MTNADERPKDAKEALPVKGEDEGCDWPCPDCKALGWQE